MNFRKEYTLRLIVYGTDLILPNNYPTRLFNRNPMRGADLFRHIVIKQAINKWLEYKYPHITFPHYTIEYGIPKNEDKPVRKKVFYITLHLETIEECTLLRLQF